MLNRSFVLRVICLLALVVGFGWTSNPGLAAAPAATPYFGGINWTLLNIDGQQDTINIGGSSSIAFDLATDIAYISYYDAKRHVLRLASPVTTASNCASGHWWCRDVDTDGDVGLGSSIAIHDAVSTVGGKLGISYYDATNKRLKIKIWGCSSPSVCLWTTYSFTAGNPFMDSGRYSSLKFDSQGFPRVAFYKQTTVLGNDDSYVRYCAWAGSGGNDGNGAFNCSDVNSAANVLYGQYPSLALDYQDQPRIVAYDGFNRDLIYLQGGASGGGDCNDTNWWCQTIDSTRDVGKFPAFTIVRVNNSNEFSIAYYDATNGKLKYAYMTGTNGNCGPLQMGLHFWRCDPVDTMGTGIGFPAIAMVKDAQNHSFIAYQDYSSDTGPAKLKIARAPGTLGLTVGNCGSTAQFIGLWQCDQLDGGGYGGASTSEGFYPSIALNSKGLVTVSYQEYDDFYTMGTLKAAYQTRQTFVPAVERH